MSLDQKQLIKVADMIRCQLLLLKSHRYTQVQGEIRLLVKEIEELDTIRDKLEVCKERGWYIAAKSLMDQLDRVSSRISYRLGSVNSIAKSEAAVPPIRSILQEVQAVEEEFGELQYDGQSSQLYVTTEAIELEDVYLGSFEIRLNIGNISAMQHGSFCTVRACNPNPAACDAGVTHPHVSNEQLCFGTANQTIHNAVACGRISDFFLLAKAVLENYNPDSPFVPLSEWHGVWCYNCGYLLNPDYTYYCEYCERDFCQECSTTCSNCLETVCQECAVNCTVCDEPNCQRCTVKCQCGKQICRRCHEEGKCICKNESEVNNDERNETLPAVGASESKAG